jgi:hypothetical protein
MPKSEAGLYTMEDLMVPYFNINKTEAQYVEEKIPPWWRVW